MYWLMKSEPGECSFEYVCGLPEHKVSWWGIRNYQARNFMRDKMTVGDGVLFYHSSCAEPGIAGIARNTVLATPVENIDLYYIDPGDSEFARLGLNYTTQGETNLIGFHAQGNYSTAVGESYAIMGMKLWAEYLDGIAKITVSAGG